MSIELMAKVWRTAPVNGSELLVLLALADFGNDDGSAIYPSIKTIAGKARLSDAQTRRIIHKLIKLGLVELVEAGGWDGNRNRANEYRIIMQPPCMDASTGTRAGARGVLAPVLVPYSRGRKGGTRVDIRGGTNTDASTVLAPVQDDPSLDPPLQPSVDPPLESSSSSSDEEDAARVLWREVCQEPVPDSIRGKLNALIAECGRDAVAHGIRASIGAGSRNFGYIAKCARNYVPPSAPVAKSYTVDLPGVHAMPPAPQPAAVPALPPPMQHDDLWATALRELLPTLSGPAQSYLDGSQACCIGERDGKPLYQVVVESRAVAGVDWLTAQTGPAIQRKLGTLLGKRVQVEIVAAELEAVV